MPKTLIALQGASNAGKSSTINAVHKMLKSKYKRNCKEESCARGAYILTIKGEKIGIQHRGDPNSKLGKSLELFANKGCKIILCATRTSGETVDEVNKFSQKYIVIWIEKRKTRPHRKNNLQMARLICLIIEAALLAK